MINKLITYVTSKINDKKRFVVERGNYLLYGYKDNNDDYTIYEDKVSKTYTEDVFIDIYGNDRILRISTALRKLWQNIVDINSYENSSELEEIEDRINRLEYFINELNKDNKDTSIMNNIIEKELISVFNSYNNQILNNYRDIKSNEHEELETKNDDIDKSEEFVESFDISNEYNHVNVRKDVA